MILYYLVIYIVHRPTRITTSIKIGYAPRDVAVGIGEYVFYYWKHLIL